MDLTEVPLASSSRSRRPVVLEVLMVVGLVLLTTAAVVAGNGNLGLAFAPVMLVLLVAAIWVLPLRVPLLTLLVLAWGMEAPGDAFSNDRWDTPWRTVGALLWGKLNLTLPVSSLVFSGLDLLLILMFGVVVVRHHQRSLIDRAGWTSDPAPLRVFAWMSLAAVVWMSLWGLSHGGSFRFVLWQVSRWIYLPLLYALMRQGLRGVADAPLVGRLLLGVGVFRAVEAIGLRMAFPSLDDLPHATTHADSVLFASCLALLGAMLLEAPSKKMLHLVAALTPLFYWAIKANNRRLVWVEVALVAAVFWLITPWRPMKRKIGRALVFGAVPLLLYGFAGWHSTARIFGPMQKIRSIVDSKTDTSTLWRDLENYDLVYTYTQSPLLGSGFGLPFEQPIVIPEVTSSYELEPYIPHNSVLGLWAFGGFFGFTLLWAVFPVGMFFTVRAYRWAVLPVERITALGAAAVQVCYLVQGYGDLGFGSWGPLFSLVTGYALVGKICVSRGGWSAPPAGLS